MKNLLQKFFNNYKIRVFLFFLMVSSGSLLMSKLSKEYKSVMHFEVVSENIPRDKILLNQPKKYISIYTKASGFNLIGYQFLGKKLTVNASIASHISGTTYKIDTHKLIDEFQKQLSFDTEIVDIIDKSIYIEMGKIISKKVPVILNSNLSYEKGYKVKGSIKLFPDSIMVSGPENRIDKITKIETNQLVLKNIFSNVNQELDLKIKSDTFKGIVLSDNKIEVFAEIEKFTELTLIIPIKVINKPKDLKITLFPSKVQLVFQVELSEIAKIKADQFVVICDVAYTTQNNLPYLIPKILEKPITVNNYHIIPSKIDYIIRH